MGKRFGKRKKGEVSKRVIKKKVKITINEYQEDILNIKYLIQHAIHLTLNSYPYLFTLKLIDPSSSRAD